MSDHERPLNKRGKVEAPRMGQLLKEEEVVPDLIISSSAERAFTTAELVALACDFEGEFRTTREFYHAGPDTYLEVLQETADPFACVMVVGHNPGMEALVEQVTGQSEHFTTANIAHVEFALDQWAELSMDTEGELINLWRPKEI